MDSPTVSPEPGVETSIPQLVRGLSLLDSVLLLAGGIIGSSIFLTAKDIAGPLPHPVLFLLVWVMGALISMCAAFAFAEMGSMFPDSGGQYVYLREAFGDLIYAMRVLVEEDVPKTGGGMTGNFCTSDRSAIHRFVESDTRPAKRLSYSSGGLFRRVEHAVSEWSRDD